MSVLETLTICSCCTSQSLIFLLRYACVKISNQFHHKPTLSASFSSVGVVCYIVATMFLSRFMWRRSGDGEVYAYMPNEQVIWIVIQIIDNKALKWCDFDHAVIKIMGQIMKMKLMALTITSPIFFRLRDSARSLTSIATMSMVTPWAEEPGGHHDNNVECCWY